jgi:hypothetical protein
MIVLVSVDCCWVSFLNPTYRASGLEPIKYAVGVVNLDVFNKNYFPGNYLKAK